ncbi:hypothetical protein [uncultured Mitsuokella sp.]|uniref:hypothetical protein n=1 Tax=uncultured Mitsuokella sp. TaxID=453120 RepID=UPI00260C7E2F|nr:hypothetical protein [uncultured Mitsuokella sp.]
MRAHGIVAALIVIGAVVDTLETLEKAGEALESDGDFIVAVSDVDKCMTLVYGDPFIIIPMAVQIIVKMARKSDDENTHLQAAMTLLANEFPKEAEKEKSAMYGGYRTGRR